MRTALAIAPPELHGRCLTTMHVESLGNACRTADGLFRVERSDGESATTHGVDGVPSTPGALLPASQQAVDDATIDDISCASTSTQRYFLLVYAHSSSTSSRYSTIAPLLRNEAYKLSAFVGAESQAIDANKTKKVHFECSSGVPRVVDVQLSQSSSGDTFGTVVSNLNSLGWTSTYSLSVRRRLLVYYDDPISNGAAGTGHLFGSDDSASTSNLNNVGSMVAVEFGWSSPRVPHWDMLLHETGHTMGAVQFSSPNTTDTTIGAHCNDGQDIMCYSDGMAQSAYDPAVCATRVFDCNRNDYFHPSPAGGSYLATHWNVAHPNNQLLDHLTIDSLAPTSPAPLTTTGLGKTSMTLDWMNSTDNVGVRGYRVERLVAGTWTQIATTTETSFVPGGLTGGTAYSFGVVAFDAAGNDSVRATLDVTTTTIDDTSAPSMVSGLVQAGSTTGSVTLDWDPSVDDVGVIEYIVFQETAPGIWAQFDTTGSTTYVATGLTIGTPYTFGVRARDDAQNLSPTASLAAATSFDTTRPTAPSNNHLVKRRRTNLKIAWGASNDDIGVHRYRIYLYRSGAWRWVGTTMPGTRSFAKGGLAPGRLYKLRVKAIDERGNLSGWSGTVRALTLY